MNGLLLRESLADLSVLDLLRVTRSETWQAQNAAACQPPVWTAMSFEADDDQADFLAEKLSLALKPQGWYINASTSEWVYIIFPQRVFKYPPGDVSLRAAARQHGRSTGIPESQLDWGE